MELTHMQPNASLAIPSQRGTTHVHTHMPAHNNNNKNDHLLHSTKYFNTLLNLRKLCYNLGMEFAPNFTHPIAAPHVAMLDKVKGY